VAVAHRLQASGRERDVKVIEGLTKIWRNLLDKLLDVVVPNVNVLGHGENKYFQRAVLVLFDEFVFVLEIAAVHDYFEEFFFPGTEEG
jgi:hypothetical protein